MLGADGVIRGTTNSLRVPFDKVALPEEAILVMSTTPSPGIYKYQIERNLYPDIRIPAKDYPHQYTAALRAGATSLTPAEQARHKSYMPRIRKNQDSALQAMADMGF